MRFKNLHFPFSRPFISCINIHVTQNILVGFRDFSLLFTVKYKTNENEISQKASFKHTFKSTNYVIIPNRAQKAVGTYGRW